MSQIELQPGGDPFSLSIFHQSVGIEGQLPFTMSSKAYTTVRSGAGTQVRRTRQTMIYSDIPAAEPYFRRPLFSLVERELASRGIPLQTSQVTNLSSDEQAGGRLQANVESNSAGEATSRRLPLASQDFILSNQHSLIEYSSHASIGTLIAAAAEDFPQARVAVLTTNRESCWQLKRQIDRGLVRSNSFVAFETLPDNEISRRRPGLNFRRVIIGTPTSLANNNEIGGVWKFDLIFIVDERLLLAEPLFNYFNDARDYTRIIVCASHSVAVDPKWQPRLFEYAGFTRGILTRGARILPQPRIAFANINWNVSGNLVLNNDFEFVDALDAENRRLRAIHKLIVRPNFRAGIDNIVLVFARRRSVDGFRQLVAGTRAIENAPEIQTVTSAELSGITIDRNTKIVWAGSRASFLDLYRTLSGRIPLGVDVSIVDIQDFPQSNNRAHSEFLQTVGGWNRERRRAYAELGYLPAAVDAQQHWLDQARRLLIQENQGVVRNV